MAYDAIIIGAGLSGLAAGVRLAMYEKRVLILEAHRAPGGLNSYYQRGKRNFDVGLHAFTNYAAKGARGQMLTKLLRQLRIRHEELELEEQWGSVIRFPSCSIEFNNDFDFFREQVTNAFPGEQRGFDRLVQTITAFDESAYDAPQGAWARQELAQYIKDPLLIEMLLCPVMFYGSPSADDMDWVLFVMIWKCFFPTGLARPRRGMRPFVEKLVEKFQALGGELRFGARVESLRIQNQQVHEVCLEKGERLHAKQIYSSAGHVETLRLCDDQPATVGEADAGSISLVELILCLDLQPKDMGMDKTIIFYSNKDRFTYKESESLMEEAAGVVCVPNHYGDGTALPEGRVRLSRMGSFSAWQEVLGAETRKAATEEGRTAYRQAKERVTAKLIRDAEEDLPGLGEHVQASDLFTPLTLKRYTGHVNGTLYGSPAKVRDGRTPYGNLFLIGTDQGFHGIVGATLSGIAMANLHGLR